MFYTNVFMRGDRIYMRGFDKGLRVANVINYKPYMFIPKADGEYRNLQGKPVAKLDFDSINDARDFVKRYEEVSNMEIYGLDSFLYLYIYDNFKGEIDYDPKKVNITILDIECKSDDGFPNIEKADQALTAITLRCRNRNYVFGLKDFYSDHTNTHYFKCKDEYELIQKFLNCWEALDIDILTGWNIEFFDIPYLVNRIKNVFNEKEAKRLSPYKFLMEKTVEFRGKENQSYEIAGISVLDYYQLYRKFTFGNQESYKLDYIAYVELNEKKVDFREKGYKDLTDLYNRNHQLFIEYNIQDCALIDKLDDKLKFLEQVMALAYDAKVNYNDTMATVKPWDVIIHNYLLDKKIVIPQFKKSKDFEALVGGYVKEPKIGLSKWVVSFDLNSLYPHLIMQYNISPETFVGRKNFPAIDTLITKRRNLDEYIDPKYSRAANGCYYNKDKQGFLPALMERMYNDRSKYKNMMIEAKKKFEQTKDPEQEKLIARYHNLQMAKKIQLNSAYGALGNAWFRWFNFNHAEAITTSGQLSIRWIEKKMNEFMNKILKTTDVDYVVASDTDSIYVTMEEMVKQLDTTDDLVIVDAIDKFCEKIIQPMIDSSYEELAEYMSAFQQKMKMKRETIANKAIWRGAKMYILNAWNVEGVQYDKPKLKMSGIEAVRSSTPHACRKAIKDSLEIIMNGNEQQLQEFVAEFKNKFLSLPFEDVAFPRSIKNMSKYKDSKVVYKLGTPIQVKGALLYNEFIKKNNIKAPLIVDGDKIRFAYLKMPNPITDTVIAAPDELPPEMKLDKYIDRDIQFEKSFLNPIKSIAEVIGWEVEQRATLESFFG